MDGLFGVFRYRYRTTGIISGDTVIVLALFTMSSLPVNPILKIGGLF